jgi:histidyl-tRNA synthetase
MKPGIPKGTRDFGPDQLIKRKYIFDIIEEVFEKFAFMPIETPAMENLSTLTGKYGEEGDRLLFKILNNGDYLAKANVEALESKDSGLLTSSISKRGLRYDLTVPFARFVVMNQNDLNFPFKRYQIQPVWRADRPQKGRYQEFFQCDADVIGSDSLLYEAELAQIYDEVFYRLGLDVTIKMNNRKILAGMAEKAGIRDRFMEMTIAIDKLDKVGLVGVEKELLERGIAGASVHIILEALEITKLDQLKNWMAGSVEGIKGVKELEQCFSYLSESAIHNSLQFDCTLARGLNYYTGCIYEVVSNETEMGSIGGGGRYDDLTEVFGLKGMSGVGISFGAERIFDIMETLNRFPKKIKSSADLLFLSFDEEALKTSFKLASMLRKEGFSIDVYPEPLKMKKQMKYANDTGVPYACIIGSHEMEARELTIKRMEDGHQTTISFSTLKDSLKDLINENK